MPKTLRISNAYLVFKTLLLYISTSSALLLFSINAQTPAANAQSIQCNAESVSRSISGEVVTQIVFINNRRETVKLYWLNYSGQRVLYTSIQAGQRIVQSTYVTHPWVITNPQDKCLGVYYPDGQPRTVLIK